MIDSKRIVVTGGSGYLAAGLLRLLGDSGCSFILLSRSALAFSYGEAPGHIQRIQADLREERTWEFLDRDIDAVFHFAAQTSVSVANENPISDAAANVLPMLHLLETCRRKQIRPAILFASTVTIAGVPRSLPVSESHPDQLLTVYDLHKKMAEDYLKYYVTREIARGAILRLANVYGPGPKSSSADRGVLNQMMAKAVRGDTLTVYGEGNQLRDYVFVDDVIKAFVAALECIDRINGEHFIIGSGTGHTISQAADKVARKAEAKTGRRVEIRQVPAPHPASAIEARNFVADISKFKKATGWKPVTELDRGIDVTIEYYLSSG